MGNYNTQSPHRHFGFPFLFFFFLFVCVLRATVLTALKANNPLGASERNPNLVNNERKWIFTEHSGLYEALCCTEHVTFLWRVTLCQKTRSSVNGYEYSQKSSPGIFRSLFCYKKFFAASNVIIYTHSSIIMRPFRNILL